MDELRRWQLQQMAERTRDQFVWLENGGALERADLAAQSLVASGITSQIQAFVDSLACVQIPTDAIEEAVQVLTNIAVPRAHLDAFFAEITKTVEIINIFENTLSGSSLKIQATYAEMIASLIGVHRVFTGIGSSFVVTLGEGNLDDATYYERKMELLAGNEAELTGDTVDATPGETAEVIRLTLSATEATNDSIRTKGVTQEESILEGGPFPIIEGLYTPQQWSIQRSEDSNGFHVFTFRGFGEQGRSVIDYLCETTQSFISRIAPSVYAPSSHPANKLYSPSDIENWLPSSDDEMEPNRMSDLPYQYLSIKEAVWALERTIVRCGFVSGIDYTSSQVGETQEFVFVQDGWKYCRIVLSPATETGQWIVSHELIMASHAENKQRLDAHKGAILELPMWQRDLYSDLPDFTEKCNEIWELLNQEWRKVALAKSKQEAGLSDQGASIASNETPTPRLVKLGSKPPGRRPDPENDVAFQMILQGKRTEEAYLKAFQYWCEVKRITKPKKHERNAFKKAMERAEDRYNNGKTAMK